MVQSVAMASGDRRDEDVLAGTARFYDAYGEFEWLRLEARAYGRLQAIIDTRAHWRRQSGHPGAHPVDLRPSNGR